MASKHRANPALGLLIYHWLWRKIVGHGTRLSAGMHDVAQAIKHCVKAMVPPLGVFPTQRRIRRHKHPLFIDSIAICPLLPILPSSATMENSNISLISKEQT